MSKTISSENIYIKAIHTIARYYDSPISYEAILANTSSYKGGSDPHLIVQGLESISLRSKVVSQKLDKLNNNVLPCVIIMNNKQPCIVYEASENYLLIDNLLGGESQRVLISELEEFYSGRAILIKGSASDVSTATFDKLYEKRNWLLGTLSHFKGAYSYALVAAFITTVLGIAPILYMRILYDKVIPNEGYSTMITVTCAVVVVLTFDAIIQVVKRYLIDFVNRNADIILSNKMIHKVLNVNLSSNNMLAGALAGRVKELEMLREYMSSLSIVALIDMPFALLFLVALYMFSGINPVMICLASVLMVVVVSIILNKVIRDYSEISYEFGHKKNSYLVEAILGLEAIKANIAEERYAGIWSEVSEAQANASKVEMNLVAIANSFVAYSINLNYMAIAAYGAYMVMEKQISVGGLVACSILSGKILMPFTQLSSLLVRYRHMKMAYEALSKVMYSTSERHKEHRYISKSNFVGQIEFQDVSFYYKDKDSLALSDVSFTINPGEKVAVLGHIGSGKSTIGKLILNLYKPTKGNIFIDGIDIDKLHPYDLRSHIGYVSQDNFLFSTTVIDNIIVSPLVRSGSSENIEQAIRIAGINKILVDKKDGLQTEVGQSGNMLSGGQRQAIAIARGLSSNAPILILDEPTSMMDSVSEGFLLDGLAALDKRTMLIISHNIKVLDIVDKVLFIEKGKVKFCGTKEDFMKLASKQALKKG